MNHWILSVFMLLSVAACKQSDQQQTRILSASVEELVASPGEFANQEVAIEGMVTHVCRHGGQKYSLRPVN